MRSHQALALLSAFLVTGCAGLTHHSDNPPNGLSNAVTVEERSKVFYNGSPRTISPDTFQPRVDYASELRLIVDTNKLYKAIGTTPSLLPLLTDEQRASLTALQKLLSDGRRYLADYATYVKQYEKLRTARLDPSQISHLKSAINKQAQSGLALLDPLNSYLEAKVREGNPSISPRDLNNKVNEFTQKIYPPGSPLNIQALADFLANESAVIIRQAMADSKTIQNGGSVSLRLRATVVTPGQSPQPIHIRNYDTLADFDVAQEPRVSFQMSDEDRQRLEAETKVNTEIAKLVKDVQNNNSDLRKSFDNIINAVRHDLTDWKQAVAQLDDFNSRLARLIDAASITAGSQAINPAESNLLYAVTNLLITATNDVATIRKAISTFTQTNDPTADPSDVLMQAADAFSTGLSTVVAIPGIIRTNIATCYADLNDLVTKLKGANPSQEAAAAPLIHALDIAAPTSEVAVQSFIETNLSQYPSLIAELKSLIGRGNLLAAQDKLGSIATDTNLLDLPITAPPDGFISLQRNIAKGGVTLALDGSLVSRSTGTSSPTITSVEHQEFDIEKCGLINTWSANLIFTKRLGSVPAGQQKENFTPAASISWTLHYTPPPGDTPPNPWWENIYPGAGINIAALSWDNGVQVGLGAHASLFHDILIAGGGYNLQASSHGAYFFVGIGLFQTLSKLGLPTPPGMVQ